MHLGLHIHTAASLVSLLMRHLFADLPSLDLLARHRAIPLGVLNQSKLSPVTGFITGF